MLILAGSLLTGVIEQELSWTSASWNHRLNEAGSASLVLPLTTYAPNAGTDALPFVARSAIWITDDDGSVAWWGVAWAADIDTEARTITLSVAQVHSVLTRRLLRRDLDFTNQDQATIAVALVTEAQTGPQRGLRIDTSGVTPTGVLRDRHYLGVERPVLGELLRNLSAVLNGFDYDFPATWSGGGQAPVPRLRIDYPTLGRTLSQPIVATGPVVLRSLSYDGTEMASDVDAIGDQAVTTPQTASQPLGADRPALDTAVSFSSVKEVATLTEHAGQWLAMHNGPARVANVTVSLRPTDALAVRVGDVVRVIEMDTVGLDDVFLVTGIAWQVAGAGREVSLDLSWPVAPGTEP